CARSPYYGSTSWYAMDCW
nr:immunoglobulin heavy chain junction region [Mus musculus]